MGTEESAEASGLRACRLVCKPQNLLNLPSWGRVYPSPTPPGGGSPPVFFYFLKRPPAFIAGFWSCFRSLGLFWWSSVSCWAALGCVVSPLGSKTASEEPPKLFWTNFEAFRWLSGATLEAKNPQKPLKNQCFFAHF